LAFGILIESHENSGIVSKGRAISTNDREFKIADLYSAFKPKDGEIWGFNLLGVVGDLAVVGSATGPTRLLCRFDQLSSHVLAAVATPDDQ
jgi:hypothetical protein